MSTFDVNNGVTEHLTRSCQVNRTNGVRVDANGQNLALRWGWFRAEERTRLFYDPMLKTN
jgi:hypothetical protein